MNSFQQYYSAGTGRFRNLPRSFRKNVPWWYQILDPGSELVSKWNHIFLITCILALFVDPLYFFLPGIPHAKAACLNSDVRLSVSVTLLRTVADLFYLMHMVMKFRTAYVSPRSRVFGRGELVWDPKKIAVRYLKKDFVIDFLATLPLPQIMIWFVIPLSRTSEVSNHSLSLIVLVQYVPRFFLIFPLNRRIIKTTGAVAKTAWSGAAYNLLLFILAGHVLGASWYLLSIQRQHTCWREQCLVEMNSTHSPSCNPSFLDCSSEQNAERQLWLKRTHLFTICNPKKNLHFEFGMFAEAFVNEVALSEFWEKYLYCLWWGLRSLSSYGQSLTTSTYASETLFCALICIIGLILFAVLIGNLQTYLQSTSVRFEEWRVKRRDTEEWMRHRQLPPELQERVRRFVQYKWLATRGVDEQAILRALPLDLQRQIQRHLCLALVRRVPFFAQMDNQLLDAICERLVSFLSTRDSFVVREGDPVNEMLFIIRGQLESSTTNGGRSGFFNSITLKPGDFCGEELLTWALLPNETSNRPSSTRTVKSLTEVEAFALKAEDLRYVAKQFKRLHSKKLQHAFRYYSHQWRTWGTCFIQVAWRRYKKRKLAKELAEQESYYYAHVLDQDDMDEFIDDDADNEGGGAEGSSGDNSSNAPHIGATILASKFAKNTRRGALKKVPAVVPDASSLKMPKMFKPQDPDFNAD